MSQPLRLWILSRRDDLPHDRDFNPWFDHRRDTTTEHIVAAPDEATARQLAADQAGDERAPRATWEELAAALKSYAYRTDQPLPLPAPFPVNPWCNPAHTTCKELTPGSAARHIMQTDNYT